MVYAHSTEMINLLIRRGYDIENDCCNHEKCKNIKLFDFCAQWRLNCTVPPNDVVVKYMYECKYNNSKSRRNLNYGIKSPLESLSIQTSVKYLFPMFSKKYLNYFETTIPWSQKNTSEWVSATEGVKSELVIVSKLGYGENNNDYKSKLNVNYLKEIAMSEWSCIAENSAMMVKFGDIVRVREILGYESVRNKLSQKMNFFNKLSLIAIENDDLAMFKCLIDHRKTIIDWFPYEWIRGCKDRIDHCLKYSYNTILKPLLVDTIECIRYENNIDFVSYVNSPNEDVSMIAKRLKQHIDTICDYLKYNIKQRLEQRISESDKIAASLSDCLENHYRGLFGNNNNDIDDVKTFADSTSDSMINITKQSSRIKILENKYGNRLWRVSNIDFENSLLMLYVKYGNNNNELKNFLMENIFLNSKYLNNTQYNYRLDNKYGTFNSHEQGTYLFHSILSNANDFMIQLFSILVERIKNNENPNIYKDDNENKIDGINIADSLESILLSTNISNRLPIQTLVFGSFNEKYKQLKFASKSLNEPKQQKEFFNMMYYVQFETNRVKFKEIV